jgi:hypothetical protein
MGPAAPGPGQITVVVDPDDSVEFARTVGAARRRSGRFVVHTSPKQYVAWRFQTEVLAALGKHWDRAAQGRSGATAAELARAWLRAERARDLVVLRAHQISGPALSWLLSLPVQEGLRLWLISPQPLPRVSAVAMSPEVTGLDVISDHRVGCGCEDLNGPGAVLMGRPSAEVLAAARINSLAQRLGVRQLALGHDRHLRAQAGGAEPPRYIAR